MSASFVENFFFTGRFLSQSLRIPSSLTEIILKRTRCAADMCLVGRPIDYEIEGPYRIVPGSGLEVELETRVVAQAETC